MRDLNGRTIRVDQRAKLSGGYADDAVPTYLTHELVKVVGFGRTRVWVKLLAPDYASRPMLRVLPRTLVLEEEPRGAPQALAQRRAPEGEAEMTTTYKIIRFKRDDANEVIDRGLTLEDAQAWCNRDDTSGDGWFDGYTAEDEEEE